MSITQSEKNNVEINASEEQLELLDVSVSNNTLTIDGDKKLGNISRKIYIDVEMKDLESIKMKKGDNENIKISNNEVAINFQKEMNGDSLMIYGQGKMEINGGLHYKYIKLFHEGIINCDLEGSTDFLDLYTQGIANIKAKDLLANDGNIYSEGISKIDVNMLNDAKIKAEGIHLVKYNDNPNIKFKREGIVLKQVD